MKIELASPVNRMLPALLASLFFLQCAEEPKEEPMDPEMVSLITNAKATAEENWNVSFLLDLSDRIDTVKYPNPAMEYYERDAAYILTIAELFNAHLRAKPLRSWNDKIQIYFDPEPSNSNINTISEELKYQFTRQNATQEILEEFLEKYTSNPKKIYELAIENGGYVGSDTWGFFKNKVKPYCVDQGHRNFLIILTDGYIFHINNKKTEGNRTSFLTPEDVRRKRLTDSSWRERMENEDFGFIPATAGLDNLEILVLNINPSTNSPYEEDVLRAYWIDWFEQMGVQRYEIQTTDLPSNTEKIIKDFLLTH